MTDSHDLSRRDWVKTIGAVSVGAMSLDVARAAPARKTEGPRLLDVATRYAPGDIVELYSTSDVFIPPKGTSYMKFSFDFPEPAVVFGEHRFSFLVFTNENTYGLDRARMVARGSADALELTCDRLVWAGGQESAAGRITARFRRNGYDIEWDVVAEAGFPIKSVTTVIRDVPRGQISFGGGQLTDT